MAQPSPASSWDQQPYHRGEEIANTITHGLGAMLSIIGLVVLAAQAADAWQLVSFSIYGATLIGLYLASTLYHGIQRPRARRILQIVDHCAIYALIAGTYTPFLLISLRGVWGWSLLAVVWSLAGLGIGFKLFSNARFALLSTLAYVAMGWLGVIAWHEVVRTVPADGVVWLVAGGLIYTAGVLFYIWDSLPYNHAIWHLFVLGGSACHFIAVLGYLLPTA